MILRPRLIVPLVVFALAVAAGCIRDESGIVNTGGPVTESNLPPCPLEALEAATSPVTVELWHALNGKSLDYLEALAVEFNASQDQVVVKPQSQGQDYNEVLDKYLSSLSSRQLPAIAYIEDVNLRLMVDTGSVLPAESCMDAEGFDPGILPTVRNYYTADGVFWPGYTNVSEPILYFNANHFTKAGLDPADPPKTLEEMSEAARTLKREAGIEKPIVLKLDSWFVESWINGAGGAVVNNDNGRSGVPTESEIDNPISLEVFTWIKDMQEEGLLEPVSDTPGQIDQYLKIAQQQSTMGIETSTAATTIKAFVGGEDIGQGETPGEVDLSALKPMAALMPGVSEPGKARVSGGAFYITNTVTPAQQAGAWKFLKFMHDLENQIGWHIEGSYLPITQAAANSPEVQEFWDTDLAGRMLKVGYDTLLAIDPERPGPAIGPYPEYDEAITKALDAMAFTGATPAEAVAMADKGIQAALDKYIEDNPDVLATTTTTGG